jgi:hypothetical protein
MRGALNYEKSSKNWPISTNFDRYYGMVKEIIAGYCPFKNIYI